MPEGIGYGKRFKEVISRLGKKADKDPKAKSRFQALAAAAKRRVGKRKE